jgi:ribosomal protein S17E
MGSLNIESIRNDYPSKSDADAAKALAEKYGYIAIVRYKNSKSVSDFTNIGTCKTEAEIRGYLTSPYCNDAELIYDGRSALFPLNAGHVLNGHCEMCSKRSTRETLQMGAGNDFYFCPKCGLLFCDSCYVRLPLTSSPGYGMCLKCRVQVKRAIPSFFIPS